MSTIAQVVAFDIQYKDDINGYAAKLSTYNHIVAMVEGMDCDDFFLTTDNGEVSRKSLNCTWNYTPYRKGIGMIYFNKIHKGDTITFARKRCVIKYMNCVPTLAPFASEKHEVLHLTYNEFMSSRLYMMVHHKFYETPMNLSSFSILIERNSKIIHQEVINKIDHYEYYMETIVAFINLREGDVILLSKIQYEYPNKQGKPFIFDTYNIQIKIK